MYKSSMTVFVDGREIELYTIGHTAKLLKKSVETMRAWERMQVIPKPMYKHKQIRLYHPLEVEAMKKVIRKLGKRPNRDELQRQMWAAIRDVRQEIRRGNTDEDNHDGDKVPMSGT